MSRRLTFRPESAKKELARVALTQQERKACSIRTPDAVRFFCLPGAKRPHIKKRRSARCRRQKHRGRSAEFFARFLATLYRNLPWALLWQIFAAGPATRGVFRAIFRRQLMENDRKAFSSDTECDKMDA